MGNSRWQQVADQVAREQARLVAEQTARQAAEEVVAHSAEAVSRKTAIQVAQLVVSEVAQAIAQQVAHQVAGEAVEDMVEKTARQAANQAIYAAEDYFSVFQPVSPATTPAAPELPLSPAIIPPPVSLTLVKDEPIEPPADAAPEPPHPEPAVLQDSGDGEFCLAEIRQAIASGNEAFERSQYPEAIPYFRKACEADIPSEEKGYASLMLAQCWMELNKGEQALSVLEQASCLPGLSSEMKRDLLYYKGILSTVRK